MDVIEIMTLCLILLLKCCPAVWYSFGAHCSIRRVTVSWCLCLLRPWALVFAMEPRDAECDLNFVVSASQLLWFLPSVTKRSMVEICQP